MTNFVVFIDEMVGPELDDLFGVYIKLLRNLCRAVHIPVILSGTDLRVIGFEVKGPFLGSRSGEPKPWVKVVTILPKATLESFGHFVKFKPWNNLNLECSVVDFIELIQTKSDLNYSLLFNSLLNVQGFNDEDLKNLENIFRFVVKQSKTNLPGIAIISCKLLVDLVIGLKPNVRIDFKAIWKKLIDKVQTAVTKCKPKIADLDGKLASLHILTFKSKIKSKHESGDNAGKKINNHFFRFGKSNEPGIFALDSDDASDSKIMFPGDSDSDKRDQCHFPKLSLDFFAHMISWNSLWVDLYEDLENPTETETVVAIYRKYLTEGGSYKVYSGPVTTHFFRLELLAHWTICNASHFNVNGYTEGVVIVKEFVKNLQVVGNLEKATFGYVNDFPPSLKSFLARVSVPYLVTPEMINTELSNELSGLTRFGKSWRPKNKVGWDVIFNAFLDETPNNCLIECKLWEKSVGLAMIHKYYKRACDLKSSLSFLVCSNFNQSLEKVFEDVTDLDLEAEGPLLPDPTEEPVVPLSEEAIEVEDKNTDSPETDEPVEISKKPKLDSATPITIDSFNQLWSQPKNQINIYTVKPILNDSFVSLEYKCIKEFPNPIGVFIITQSLFQLSRRL